MIIAVIGCGNVGANLLLHCAGMSRVEKIFALDVSDELVQAAIMDVAGAKPYAADNIVGVLRSELPEADIIVFSAGVKAKKDQNRDIKDENKSIIDHYLYKNALKKSAIVITLPGPVEYLAAYIQKSTGLAHSQVIGFGGELDKNRLLYTLNRKNIDPKGALVIGGHASRAIPVYDNENDYKSVMGTVRNFLKQTGALAGKVRNLATAPLLTQLIESIIKNKKKVMCVSGYHSIYNLYLAWPFEIGDKGASNPISLNLSLQTQKELDLLIEREQAEKIL